MRMNGSPNSLVLGGVPAADRIPEFAPDLRGDRAVASSEAAASFAAILQNTIGRSGLDPTEAKLPERPDERPTHANTGYGDINPEGVGNRSVDEVAVRRQHDGDNDQSSRRSPEREREESSRIDAASERDERSKTETEKNSERTDEGAPERSENEAAAKSEEKRNREKERPGRDPEHSDKKGKGTELIDLKNLLNLSEFMRGDFLKRISSTIGESRKDGKGEEQGARTRERSAQSRLPIDELIRNLEEQISSKKSSEGNRIVYLNPEKWSVHGKADKKNETVREKKGTVPLELLEKNSQSPVQKPVADGARGSGDSGSGANGFNLFRGQTQQLAEGRQAEATAQHLNRNTFNELVSRARLNMGPDGRSSATIRLHPRHLGQMTLNLDMRDNQLHARLLVDSAEVRKMVLGELDILRQDLARHGITIENFSVKLREPDSLNEQAFAADRGQEGENMNQRGPEGDEGWSGGERESSPFGESENIVGDLGYEINHLPFGEEIVGRESINISV